MKLRSYKHTNKEEADIGGWIFTGLGDERVSVNLKKVNPFRQVAGREE